LVTCGNVVHRVHGRTCKKRGSGRRKKAVAKVARLHQKVRRQRLDHAHKTALGLFVITMRLCTRTSRSLT